MLTNTVLLPITFVKNTRVQSTGTRNIGPDKYTYNIIEFERWSGTRVHTIDVMGWYPMG